ncbi:MAG TPA: exonuclease domain-containing protein [Usitatibacter sp.]|nr:exonuclease domain-containing protein [Usitatibacter sp.]
MFAPAIAFVDLETTGTTPTGDRITEIGIVRVHDGELVEEWSSLVNPECSIPEEIQALTGIDNDMVRGAPTFSELRREVHERLEGHVFVAHNARFDYGFLKNEFRRVEMPFTADVLCTVRLSRMLYREAVGHSLDAIIARHGLMLPPPWGRAGEGVRCGRHSALGDARVLWEFVKRVYREKEVPDIVAAVKRLLKIPSLPPQLPADVFENLPEGPGVYRFYGVNELPLYIGKSVNLRDRIRSHFSSDYRSANDVRLSGEIRRIEVDETAGELGALLREARLVKELLPLHNYKLRRKMNACFIHFPTLGCAPEILLNKDIDWSARERGGEALFGPFAAKLNVRKLLEEIAAEEGLCWRQLGWEKRGGPCFARQVKKCRGACIGEESPQQHNLRLVTALAPWRVADWPWDGRVVIRESHPDGRFQEAHVFERWCHLGTARDDDSLAGLLEARAEADFDPDIYKIVQSFIVKHRGAVRPVPRAATPAAEEMVDCPG